MSLFMKRGAPGEHLHPPRIACFVCGAAGPADYPVYAEPQLLPRSPPYFPFLLAHTPPLGVQHVESSGETKACRLCYTSLMRQWDEYEMARVPLIKRTYYIKRVDGLPFITQEAQVQATAQLQNRLHALNAAAVAAAAPPAQLVASSPSGLGAPPAGRVPPTASAAVATLPAALMAAPPPATTTALAGSSRPPSSASVVVMSQQQQQQQPQPLSAATDLPAKPARCSPPQHGWPSRSSRGTHQLDDTPSSSLPPSSSAPGDNDSALDLSSGSRDRDTVKSRSSVVSHTSAVSHPSSLQSEGGSSSTEILDLTLPDKNAAFEVCYVCGDDFKRGTLSYTFAKQMNNKEPFYPSLMCHPRPPRSQPIDSSGRVQTCDECHNHLLQQWYKFESEDLTHSDRDYVLRKRQAQPIDKTTFVCYICALDYHSSELRLLYSRPNTENEPYYPFIEKQKPPHGASPISPQGMVQVCTLCYKSTKEKHHGQPPPKKRRPNSFTMASQDPQEVSQSGGVADDEDKGIPADVTCILCRRKFSVGSFKFLHTQPPPAGGLPFFPFLTDMPSLEEFADLEEDKQSRVRACQACTTSLMNQWTNFQRENVNIEERQYTYPSLVTGPRSVSSVRAQSPASQRSGGTVTPIKAMAAGAVGPAGNLDAPPNAPRTRSNTLESRPRSTPHSPNPHSSSNAQSTTTPARATPTKSVIAPPPACHSPAFSVHSSASAAVAAAAAAAAAAASDSQQAASPATPGPAGSSSTTTAGATTTTGTGTSLSNSNANASQSGPKTSTSSSSFYCFLCGLHSELSFSRMLYSTAPGKKAPYFPFMKSHIPKNRAETLREDGTALVCTFCYHSVMVQWTKYNDHKNSTPVDQRKYNLHDYNCYVCGITTYRKRIRALRALDFPFLRDHKTRKEVITMENGEMMAVCYDCYESLRSQFNEGERYGIPVEKRQYNWMQIPPPPEESITHITTPQERLLKPPDVAKPSS